VLKDALVQYRWGPLPPLRHGTARSARAPALTALQGRCGCHVVGTCIHATRSVLRSSLLLAAAFSPAPCLALPLPAPGPLTNRLPKHLSAPPHPPTHPPTLPPLQKHQLQLHSARAAHGGSC
jgi:hypothetical protein